MGAENQPELLATLSSDTSQAAMHETCRLEWARDGGCWKDTLSGNQEAHPHREMAQHSNHWLCPAPASDQS